MSASVNFHSHGSLGRIRASSTSTTGAPLTLRFFDDHGKTIGEATFFTDDQDYTDRLITAINEINDVLAADNSEGDYRHYQAGYAHAAGYPD